ncbi:MAG: hypothetical protein ACYTBX_08155 [Planctomycetota bacterium]|jgi:hypothetical protein
MEEISKEELVDMKLHDEIDLGDGILIRKVVGGWIYWRQSGTIQSASIGLAGVFVPEPKFTPKQR